MSKDALVEDIRTDIRVAQRSLDREGYVSWKGDGWLKGKKDGEGGGRGGEEDGGRVKLGSARDGAMCMMDP